MNDNLQPICVKCIEERRKKVQQYLRTNGLHIGDLVKVPLGKKKRIEHVWVIVSEIINPDVFNGKIDNHPTLNHNIKLGDIVKFKIKDIEQINGI